jgi:hypothetical protein
MLCNKLSNTHAFIHHHTYTHTHTLELVGMVSFITVRTISRSVTYAEVPSGALSEEYVHADSSILNAQ